MRRWNGWGDDSRRYPVAAGVQTLLSGLVGSAARPRDISLAEAVRQVPESRLPAHPLINGDAKVRLLHARGQSFPDLVALRSGQIGGYPDGVAFPESAAEVRALLAYAQECDAQLIPYGGGTSVVGHINPGSSSAPVLTVSLARLNRLLQLDEHNRLATFGAGIAGPDLEAHLRTHGYTLGHFPQSFELSTLGGWIATRSSGQQSLGFGRIEQLFAGGHVESPAGPLDLPSFPASAAGPDLRELVLGSEGRLGIITAATVRIRPVPDVDDVHTVFFPDWDQAHTAVRTLIQSGIPLSMLRLSTPGETMTNLAMAGHRGVVATLERGLALRGVRAEKCLLMLGVLGSPAQAALSRKSALAITRQYGGVHIGRLLGRQWQKGRFRAPYVRNELWEHGYAVDTLETATSWDKVPALVRAIEHALQTALADQHERVHAFTHLSHVYRDGSSIYTTYVFRLGADPEVTLQRWRQLKQAASQAIVAHGATISHQHGVGVDHQPYLAAEKGPLGMAALQQLVHTFDPEGRLNPGKLLVP